MLFIPASGKELFSSALLFKANFVLVETMIQITLKSILIEQPFSHYWKPFSTCFYIYIPTSIVFQPSEKVFFNESFIPAGGMRIFV